MADQLSRVNFEKNVTDFRICYKLYLYKNNLCERYPLLFFRKGKSSGYLQNDGMFFLKFVSELYKNIVRHNK